MKHLLSIIVSIACLLVSLHAQAQLEGVEYDWKLRLNKAGIQVFTSKVPGSAFKATRSTMVVEASPASIVALLMDLENCKKWTSTCVQARVIKNVSASENYVYSVTDVPFPLKSRDMVGHITWEVDAESGKVSSTGRALPDEIELKKGLVRVEHADSNWHFTPLSAGQTLIENYTHVDPNGPVPAFLVNLLLVNTPYKSLYNIRKRLKEGVYDKAELPF